jgi:ribosomal protein S7
LITNGARTSTFRNIKSAAECLADEIMNASKVNKIFLIINREPTTHLLLERRKKLREFPRVTDEQKVRLLF